MKAPVQAGIVSAFCVCIAGCAVSTASSYTTASAAPIRATISAHDVSDAITIGKSTKGDVLAALGPTQAIRFDSGFEVWVYQYKSDAPAKATPVDRRDRAAAAKRASGKSEFVVLFSQSGVVAKTRVRHAP